MITMLRLLPQIQSMTVIGLLVVFLLPMPVIADETEFAFDLFSDIAPILSLFGEQFARQFTSESFTWLDHLIFAMVPLGILTMIKGAIRVQGPKLVKAFIGRARENRTLAEFELMSSTSKEVSEVFNGSSIIRVMGQPKIAQFLIFPNEYDRLENYYQKMDMAWQSGNVAPKFRDQDSTSQKEIEGNSCGIHSLRTAEQRELIDCDVYRTESYKSLVSYLKKLLNNFTFLKQWQRKKLSDPESGSRNMSNQEDGQTKKKDRFPWLGPPNLQLNLANDHLNTSKWRSEFELYLAAIGAVLLQTGLIVIAAVTTFHFPTRTSLSFTPRAYGFPCYVVGSVLLCWGMGICSLIIERNSIEHCWTVSEDTGKEEEGRDEQEHGKIPRLIWVQRSQTADDQAFKGYIILAGAKRYVITSCRIEDFEPEKVSGSRIDTKSKTEKTGNHQDSPGTRKSSSEGESSSTKDALPRWKLYNASWELLTVAAVTASSFGFISQFVGLRSMAFPVSIFQIVATFIMALIRAAIRRRLGHVPRQYDAPAKYELEDLAACIASTPEFRSFDDEELSKIPGNSPALEFEVGLPPITPQASSQLEPFYFHSRKDILPKFKSEQNNNPPETTSNPASALSSQQLLRVRERLGDLCGWASETSNKALCLATSIELFMNTFLPKTEGHILDWVLPTTFGNKEDYICVPVRRRDNDGWEVDTGILDSTLSLWMANIEPKLLAVLEERANSTNTLHDETLNGRLNWRRTKAEPDSKYTFFRILGDDYDDGVLSRDISRWVDEQVTAIGDGTSNSDNSSNSDESTEIRGKDKDVKNNSGDGDAEWRPSEARKYNHDILIAIGFNGTAPPAGKTGTSTARKARELGVISSGDVPTILTQHLFTSFMWTIAQYLPSEVLGKGFDVNQKDVEIEGRDTFDHYRFKETWNRPKLRHRILTKTVRQMESFGLGTVNDILFCMIPALSSRDLLPNHVILRLLPEFGRDNWTQPAHCYGALLRTSIRSDEDTAERFCYNVIAATIDFLHLASEPYNEGIEVPDELKKELKAIVKAIVSEKFSPVLKKLAPVYNLQGRRESFESIIRRFTSDKEKENYSMIVQQKMSDTKPGFLKNTLGFSDLQIKVCSVIESSDSFEAYLVLREFDRLDPEEARTLMVAPDIFGWCPVHYLCLFQDSPILNINRIFGTMREKGVRFYELIDKMGRSPLHVAASRASDMGFKISLEILQTEERIKALTASGKDGMTPLHLCPKAGRMKWLNFVTREIVTQTDIWGRQAIHVATSFGHVDATTKLLKLGSPLEIVDWIGKSPLDYLMSSKLAVNAEEQHISEVRTTEDAELEQISSDKSTLKAEGRKLLLEFASTKLDCVNSEGQSCLHIAVEAADYETVKSLLEKGINIDVRDSSGRTPLHCAILAGRTSMASQLINEYIEGQFKADLRAVDNRKKTALMLAAQKNLLQVAKEIILASGGGINLDDADNSGRTALHYAVESSSELETPEYQVAELLITNGCDPTKKDRDGDSPLHCAVLSPNFTVASYLLSLDKVQEDVSAKTYRDSPLIAACKSGCSQIVPELLRLWPHLINDADSANNQTPLSWACEEGYRDIARILLDQESVDVNLATKYREYTPLHFAAAADDIEVLKMLLKAPSIKLDLENRYGKTPLDLAVEAENPSNALVLLRDFRTSALKRSRFAIDFSKGPFEGIVEEVVNLIDGESLTDDELVELIDDSDTLDKQRICETILTKTRGRGGRKEGTDPRLRTCMVDSTNIEDTFYLRPHNFLWAHFEDNIAIVPYPEDSHDNYTGVHDIQVKSSHYSYSNACIRSKHHIPFDASAKNYFYFEVEILADSVSKGFGIGFCNEHIPLDQYPGWFDKSWAYHGDDGCLYLEDAETTPYSSFGEAVKYGAGDIVGACLNLETGEGFFTRNDRRLDIGAPLTEKKFDPRDMYPCVGFGLDEEGLGLRFVVNFGTSPHHPFRYTGPFY